METQSPMRQRPARGWLLLAALLFAGCGQLNNAAPPADQDYLLTAQTGPGDTREGVSQRFGGEVIAWQPDSGFAVLKLTEAQAASLRSGRVSLQNTTLETNSRTKAPETVKATGFSAWAGGFSAWAGGWSAWAGGNGSITGLTTENSTIWNQIGLAQAQTAAPNLGQNVKVAVIDSGADLNHPAISSRLIDRYDFVANDATPHEEGADGNPGYGHGTSVTGIVAQVAPKAMIMVYRVLGSDGSGTVSAVVAAIDRAMQTGAQVINLSLGTDTASTALTNMICTAASRKIYVVASAGNSNTDGLTFPAQQSKSTTCTGLSTYLISVSSVNSSDIKSGFSSYNQNLDMAAPGEKIYGPAPGNRVSHWSGTSMAAPLASGALALALGQGKGATTSLKSSLITKGVLIAAKNLSYSSKLGASRLHIPTFLSNAP